MLEKFQARLKEIDTAIEQTRQNLIMLSGHKTEVEFQISEFKKEVEAAAEAAKQADENLNSGCEAVMD